MIFRVRPPFFPTGKIQPAQLITRTGTAFAFYVSFGRGSVPSGRGSVIDSDSIAEEIYVTQLFLRLVIAFCGSFSVPFGRFTEILFNPVSGVIQIADSGGGVNVSRVKSLAVPFYSLVSVQRSAVETVQVIDCYFHGLFLVAGFILLNKVFIIHRIRILRINGGRSENSCRHNCG